MPKIKIPAFNHISSVAGVSRGGQIKYKIIHSMVRIFVIIEQNTLYNMHGGTKNIAKARNKWKFMNLENILIILLLGHVLCGLQILIYVWRI